MKVKLISYTQDALTVLLRTKITRLAHNDDPANWTEQEREDHLQYMLNTIHSSWEFVDYIFNIEGVTRAFTHQFVRTRTGSYAQESQRTVDVSDHVVSKPESVANDELLNIMWGHWEAETMHFYSHMLESGIPAQDARGILPTNINTSITAKFNLRTLSDMAKTRLCTRTQGEYQQVFREMRRQVLYVHPWAKDFLQVHCVATGTCAFPRYGKHSCKFYDPRMNLDELRRETHEKFWATEMQVAVPVAVNGKTM
jgi:flavin-dependent thymidylate synthase